MKTRMLIAMLALCVFSASCGSGTKSSSTSTDNHKSQEYVQTDEDIAHKYNSITLDEFISSRFTYLIEKKLPCRVYVDKLQLNDVIREIKESPFSICAECEEYEGSVYGEVKYDLIPDWVGTPTLRKNECWADCRIGKIPFEGISCHLGLDVSQTEWLVKKAMECERFYQIVDAKIIIRIDQFRKGDDISVKADLVQILDEE